MNEVLAIARFGDALANGIVDLPAADMLTSGYGIENELDSCIAALADDFKNFAHPVGRRWANKPRPCDVVINGVRRVLLAPDIEQNEVTLADRRGVVRVGPVVRVGAVG